jgi:hypothetical protein
VNACAASTPTMRRRFTTLHGPGIERRSRVLECGHERGKRHSGADVVLMSTRVMVCGSVRKSVIVQT